MGAVLHCGDVRDVLATLPEQSVQCVVTSPPYFGLRDYGVPGQLGLEASPDEYVAAMVGVFRSVRRVLRDDGVLWLNLGDSYAGARGGAQCENGQMADRSVAKQRCRQRDTTRTADGLKAKDLIGIPWRVAFALQADGWYLRSDIIWAKPNPMPESVTDRPTKSHEYLFLLTKSERYHYDAAAIAEEAIHAGRVLDYTGDQKANTADATMQRTLPRGRLITVAATRNTRTVWRVPYDRKDAEAVLRLMNADVGGGDLWTITTQPYAGAHFATFPEDLARRCVLAGSKSGDTCLDPFGGSGTVAAVATGHGRNAVHIDLNPAYIELARQRIGPMLCTDATTEAA